MQSVVHHFVLQSLFFSNSSTCSNFCDFHLCTLLFLSHFSHKMVEGWMVFFYRCLKSAVWAFKQVVGSGLLWITASYWIHHSGGYLGATACLLPGLAGLISHTTHIWTDDEIREWLYARNLDVTIVPIPQAQFKEAQDTTPSSQNFSHASQTRYQTSLQTTAWEMYLNSVSCLSHKITSIQRRVDLWVDTNSLEEYSTSIFRQPWRWRQYVPPKRWYLPISPHGVTTQETNIDIYSAVRISNRYYRNTGTHFFENSDSWWTVSLRNSSDWIWQSSESSNLNEASQLQRKGRLTVDP
jgi:hypothetical protein